jgi:putative heme-binding domain-containing protein
MPSMKTPAPGRRASIAFACCVLTALALGADGPTRGSRPAWTTSRFAGTPEPPPPFEVVPAFPKLTFDRPVLLTFVPGTDQLVVGEVGGKVVGFPNDPEAARVVVALDLAAARPGRVALYGLAFHPKFETNRYVYACYAYGHDAPEGTRVSRFKAKAADPLSIDPTTEQVVITYPSGGHNAGCLAFGPDGFLYIATGDSAAPTPPDPLKTGQDISDLLSSILRIDVDRRDPGKAYRIPPDNPFKETKGARPEIWAYGLRNPWRMSFDRERGDLWVGDVGWELWEMIHLVRSGSNCGWAAVEGHQPVLADAKLGPTPIVPPVIEHPHSEAASITGGYVYRGSRLKPLIGTYIYGDYQSGKIWGLKHDGRGVTWRGELADSGLRLVSFGEDRAGEVYLVEHERTNGVYRLAPRATEAARPPFPRRLSESGLFASTKDLKPAPGVLPYSINAELWADGARAERLLAVPGVGKANVDQGGLWRLPDGSVLARTVTLDLTEGDPKSRRRLETQVLHREAGSWRPYTYIWDDAQADATLAEANGSSRTFTVRDASAPGGVREHAYRFAARSECALCHNPWVEAQTTIFGRQSASPLALSTAQLDKGKQLDRLSSLGLVASVPSAGRSARLADPRDAKAPLEARARAYLQANCAHCHQNGAGGSANIVLDYLTPLDKTRALGAEPAQGRFGIDGARIVAAGEPERSVLYYRIAKTGSGRMPRVGSDRVDVAGSRLIADWIAGMSKGKANRYGDDLAAVADPSASESSRREAIGRLLGSTNGGLALVRRLDSGAINGPSRRELAEAARRSARPEVLDLFERFLPESERSKRLGDSVNTAALLAQAGDSSRGRELFRAGGTVACRTCHRAEGEGGEVGPALDGIGTKYKKAETLMHILEPSKLVEPKYATHAIANRDGRVHVGLLVEENAREVVLRDANGQSIRVPAGEIEARRREEKSLMPEGAFRDLTARQAADLLEYLASLKGR